MVNLIENTILIRTVNDAVQRELKPVQMLQKEGAALGNGWG